MSAPGSSRGSARGSARGRLAHFVAPEYHETLLRNGYAIVNVCDATLAAQMCDNILQDLHTFNPKLDPHDTSTWTTNEFPNSGHGMVDERGAGHWKSAWVARLATLTAWSRVFDGIDADKLVTSWDGLPIASPEYQTRVAKRDAKDVNGLETWMHRDQRLSIPEVAHSIQGVLALTESGPYDYSTVVLVPKSGTAQQLSDDFCAAFGSRERKTHDEDWVVYNAEEREWLALRCTRRKLQLKAGQMALWLSSTPHCGGLDASPDHTYRLRVGLYVAALPRCLLSDGELKKRQELASKEKACTSSHVPVVPAKRSGQWKQRVKSYYPQMWGKPLPDRFPPVVSGFKRAMETPEDVDDDSEFKRACARAIGF